MKPFIINSNICTQAEDIQNLDSMYSTVAGNTGNSYITYSLCKAIFGGIPSNLKHIPNIYKYDFSNQNKDIYVINNESTHVFFILQDQIRISESYGLKLPYENIISFLDKINKPIIIAGLGANSFNGYDKNFYKELSPDLVNFLKYIADKTEVIGLRGEYTKEILEQLGILNTQVIGCPSFFETGENRIIIKKEWNKDFKFAISGYSHKKNYKNAKVVKFLQDEDKSEYYPAKAICGEGFDYKQYKWNKILREFNYIRAKKYRIFSSIEDWKKSIAEFDFLFGSRLHGAILALNSGVCSCVTNPDSRAREMSEFLKIPYMPHHLKSKNIKEVYEECDYETMNKIYPELYKNYIEFLNKNNVQIIQNRENIEYIKQPSLKLY